MDCVALGSATSDACIAARTATPDYFPEYQRILRSCNSHNEPTVIHSAQVGEPLDFSPFPVGYRSSGTAETLSVGVAERKTLVIL